MFQGSEPSGSLFRLPGPQAGGGAERGLRRREGLEERDRPPAPLGSALSARSARVFSRGWRGRVRPAGACVLRGGRLDVEGYGRVFAGNQACFWFSGAEAKHRKPIFGFFLMWTSIITMSGCSWSPRACHVGLRGCSKIPPFCAGVRPPPSAVSRHPFSCPLE